MLKSQSMSSVFWSVRIHRASCRNRLLAWNKVFRFESATDAEYLSMLIRKSLGAAANDIFIIVQCPQLIVYSLKCQKSVKNAHPNFPKLDVTPSYGFFCPNNSLKHKDSPFIYFLNHKWHRKAASSQIQEAKPAILFFLFWKNKWIDWFLK